jgi:hypothetical protein
MLQEAIAALEEVVRAELQRQPRGFSEHELITALRASSCPGIPESLVGDPLLLFRTHFLLFHVLYRLRDRLRAEARGELRIGVLRIAVAPYGPGRAGIAHSDPLRDYYLDLSNLEKTTEEDVVRLLDGFWSRGRAEGDRAEALAVMDLTEPVDLETIKRRYRQLAMRYHPDRGGDTLRLQEINAAMETLSRCYR